MVLILGECACMRQAPKQAIEWALDYHLGTLRRDYRDLQRLLVEAQTEYKEITGKEPGEYSAEAKLQRMQKEIDYYLDLRKEIIELPRCDEPAFEAREEIKLSGKMIEIPIER